MDVYKVDASPIRPRYIVDNDAAKYLSMHTDVLKKLRQRKLGPPYIYYSSRKVLYDIQDLDAWLAQFKVDTKTYDAFKACFGDLLHETNKVE